MVQLIGGAVGKSADDDEISNDFGLGEGNKLFWPTWSKSDVLVLESKGIGIFPTMMNNNQII